MSDMQLDKMMQEALRMQGMSGTTPTPTKRPSQPPKLVKRDEGGPHGSELTAEARTAVEYGLVRFNAIADEREALLRKVDELKNEIVGLKIHAQSVEANLNEAMSRLVSAQLTRDQCVADVAKYEVMFLSFRSQLETFLTPGVPLAKVNAPDGTTGL